MGPAPDQVHGARQRANGSGLTARSIVRMGKEGEIRQKIFQMDLIEAVIGLEPNLFYGTGLAACILVVRQRTLLIDRHVTH